jgi:hypothetical protein
MEAMFPASELAKQITITIRIKGLSLWRLRLSIGVAFFKLGAKIIGCGVKIEDMAEDV